jgi:hypothetical protein
MRVLGRKGTVIVRIRSRILNSFRHLTKASETTDDTSSEAKKVSNP